MGLFSTLFGNTDNQALSEAIREGAFLVDVRTPHEFAEGTVPGAVNIPLGSIATQLEKFRSKKKIVVFCRSGQRSSEARSVLERNGFHNVVNGGSLKNVELSTNKQMKSL